MFGYTERIVRPSANNSRPDFLSWLFSSDGRSVKRCGYIHIRLIATAPNFPSHDRAGSILLLRAEPKNGHSLLLDEMAPFVKHIFEIVVQKIAHTSPSPHIPTLNERVGLIVPNSKLQLQ
jgi:hypothetical protein